MISRLPYGKPNPRERPPKRPAVTIIAGFKCLDGIVICADTEETIGNISKRSVPKLRFEPETPTRPSGVLGRIGGDVAVAFCGSSDNGAFVDKIVDSAWEKAKQTDNLNSACDVIEQSITDTYRDFGQIYQAGYCPSAELIYGVKANRATRLFYASGPVINEKETYSTGGVGYYMADFLAERMYGRYMNLRQCVILAAYVLLEAKEHVYGCGGESHIAILREDGVSGRVASYRIDTMTKLLKEADEKFGHLIIRGADTEENDEEFAEVIKIMTESFSDLRKLEKDKLENYKAMWDGLSILGVGPPAESDCFGLPKS